MNIRVTYEDYRILDMKTITGKFETYSSTWGSNNVSSRNLVSGNLQFMTGELFVVDGKTSKMPGCQEDLPGR
jgi:hypothetical protein